MFKQRRTAPTCSAAQMPARAAAVYRLMFTRRAAIVHAGKTQVPQPPASTPRVAAAPACGARYAATRSWRQPDKRTPAAATPRNYPDNAVSHFIAARVACHHAALPPRRRTLSRPTPSPAAVLTYI